LPDDILLTMKKYIFIFNFIPLLIFAEEVLKVDDPLSGTTKGIMEGGELTMDGWVATSGPDSRISYDLGVAYGEGRLEIELKNFLPCQQPNAEKCHIITMYQTEKQERDSVHLAGESYFIIRTGTGYFDPCEYKVLTRPICEPGAEIDYEARVETNYQWDYTTTYRYIVEWKLNGNIKVIKDNNIIYEYTHIYPPYYRYILIGRDRTTKPNYGEQPGTIYKNIKIYVNEDSKLINNPCNPTDAGIGNDIAQLEDTGHIITMRILPIDDTFTSKGEPDSIKGSLDNFQVGGDGSGSYGRVIFLKFDLNNFKGYKIISAKVSAYVTNSGYVGGISRQIDNDWEEESLTYNNMPVPNTNIISNQGYFSVNDMVFWDVTSIISQGEINSFNIISLSDDGSAFYSKEYSDISKRPYLEIIAKYESIDAGVEKDMREEDILSEDESSENVDTTIFSDIPAKSDTSAEDGLSANDIPVIEDNLFFEDISKLDTIADTHLSDSSSSCSCNFIE